MEVVGNDILTENLTGGCVLWSPWQRMICGRENLWLTALRGSWHNICCSSSWINSWQVRAGLGSRVVSEEFAGRVAPASLLAVWKMVKVSKLMKYTHGHLDSKTNRNGGRALTPRKCVFLLSQEFLGSLKSGQSWWDSAEELWEVPGDQTRCLDMNFFHRCR